MQKIRTILFVAILFAGSAIKAQDVTTIQEYINSYKDIAIAEELRTGVPAAIKLAQGIHETTAGTSVLVRKSNNHFGIKCKSNWTGETVSHTDDAPNECFRKYDEPSQSYRDHSDFLKGSNRYAFLFDLDPTDYKGWAYGLKKAGYATNPKYPLIIIRLVEEYHLQDYTLIALGRLQPNNQDVAVLTAAVKTTPAASTTATEAIQESPVEEEVVPSYPAGEFRINDTKVVFVKRDTPLLEIAQRYDVPLARLIEYNELPQTETLSKSQLIYLQRKRKTGDHEFHIVKAGETIQTIARDEAIRLDALLVFNQLSASQQPAVGEKLYLRSNAPGTPRLEKKVLASRE